MILNEKGIDFYNLGTGKGYSVLELVKTFARVNNVEIPIKIVERRPGDISECYADPSYAKEKLHWEAELELDSMLKSAYDFWIYNK